MDVTKTGNGERRTGVWEYLLTLCVSSHTNLWPGRFVKDKIYEETSMEYFTIMLILVKDDCGKAEKYVLRRYVVTHRPKNSQSLWLTVFCETERNV